MMTTNGIVGPPTQPPKGCISTGRMHITKRQFKVGEEMKERVIAASPIFRHTWPEHNRSKYKPHIGKKQGRR